MRDPFLDHILPRGATTVPKMRQAAKIWASQNRGISAPEFRQIATAFIQDSSDLRKCMGGILLGYMPVQRRQLAPFLYNLWLEHTVGWAAVDAICYGNFTATEMLEDFPSWKRVIIKLAKSRNINKRRGAIVLLTKPVTQSDDARLSELAFHVIDTLKAEKDILITKAISWMLRSLVKLHSKEVKEYLLEKKGELPAIAVRETLNKLQHGTKSGK